MGISLEEFLKDREACAHCDETGNQETCITTLLSREDSCIFYNALTKNGDPHDDTDVAYLQNFRAVMPGHKVLDYYVRASKIVQAINDEPGDHTDLWMDITRQYVHPIIAEVRSGKNEEAYAAILAMLDTLETGKQGE
jgi:hypothetical protein